MGMNTPKDGAPGTTDQSPRWEGPQESRPRGYLPAKDDPDIDRDAVGENNQDPERNSPSDALKTKEAPRASLRNLAPMEKALESQVRSRLSLRDRKT